MAGGEKVIKGALVVIKLGTSKLTVQMDSVLITAIVRKGAMRDVIYTTPQIKVV